MNKGSGAFGGTVVVSSLGECDRHKVQGGTNPLTCTPDSVARAISAVDDELLSFDQYPAV